MEPDPTQEKKRRLASGPIGNFLRKQAEKERLRELAKSIAASTAAKVVAGVMVAGASAGTVGTMAANNVVENRIPEETLDAIERLEALEGLVGQIEGDAVVLAAGTEALDERIKALASALSVYDSINDAALNELEQDLANISQTISGAAGSIERNAADIEREMADLDNVIVNQNVLGARTEALSKRLTVVAAGLDTVSVEAGTALVAAREAQEAADAAADLAGEALDDAAAVARTVASVADQVDALAQEVEDAASRLDDLAAEVDALAADVDDLTVRVNDHEMRLQAEEAEPAVVANDYDDSEVRERIETLESEMDSVEAYAQANRRHLPEFRTAAAQCDGSWRQYVAGGNKKSAQDYWHTTQGILSETDPAMEGEPVTWWMQAKHRNNGQVRWTASGTGTTVFGTWFGNSLYTDHSFQIRCSRPMTFAGTFTIMRSGGVR